MCVQYPRRRRFQDKEANAVYCVKDERPEVATNKEVDVQSVAETAERFAAVEVAA